MSQTPRAGWRETIQTQGLIYNRPPGAPTNEDYWNETAAYSFTPAEIEQLEAVTSELFDMCVAAGDHIIEHDLWEDFGIPKSAVPAIIQTWNDDTTPSIYGRFDLAYDGAGPAKLLEFNADTPTSLLESAVVQWYWLQDTHPDLDQWNSLHEALIAAWRRRRKDRHIASAGIAFASSEREPTGEDLFNTLYLQDTATQAGFATQYLPLETIGHHAKAGFVDEVGKPIATVFKLYPWEWMLEESYGPLAIQSIVDRRTAWIEPIYKMLWSNKTLLAVLWQLYPHHPNLLPCYLDDPRELTSYASKPLLGREGQGIILVQDGNRLAEGVGSAALGRRVYQGLQLLPDFDGHRPVLGSWVIDGEPAGLGIRETSDLITDNGACFVPHVINAKE